MPYLIIALGYLLGSLPTAYIAGRFIKGKNIQQMGDGNIGAQNALAAISIKEAGILTRISPASFNSVTSYKKALTLAYLEHLGAAYRANPLRCRPAVLHSYRPGILHFPLGATLHTITLHLFTSLFLARISHSSP